MSRRSSSTSYSMLAYSSLAVHSLRRSTTPAGKVRRGVCVVMQRGMFSSLSERYTEGGVRIRQGAGWFATVGAPLLTPGFATQSLSFWDHGHVRHSLVG